jgi:hypothetical protein
MRWSRGKKHKINHGANRQQANRAEYSKEYPNPNPNPKCNLTCIFMNIG